MSENGTKDQEMFAIEGQRILQQLHEQGIIDLDAPMRQLIDHLDPRGRSAATSSHRPASVAQPPINGGSWLITTKTTGTSAAASWQAAT